MALTQMPVASPDYFQTPKPQIPGGFPINADGWKDGWDVNAPASTKRQLSMVGPTSPAQSLRSGMSSPRPFLETLAESDKESSDEGSAPDHPLYSAAIASFSALSVPTTEQLEPCESAKAPLIKPTKSRTVSFEEAKANLAEIWPFGAPDVKNVRVKRPSFTKVSKNNNPLATMKSVVPPEDEDRLLSVRVDSLSPDKPPADRLKEAETLLAEFQKAYKTRSMSIHELEKHIDDQSTQLKESEIWSESLGRRMMSLTSRISEQETAILQLGQELGKEKEKRREEEDEAFQHKLDGLTRVYPPVTETIQRRVSTIPSLSRSLSIFSSQNVDPERRESTAHGYERPWHSSRNSSSASSDSISGAQGAGYPRRASFFAKIFRHPSESGSSDGSAPPSRLSSFSSRASTYLNSNSSKVVVTEKQIQGANLRVQALEEIQTECQVLRQRLQSLELALSSLSKTPSETSETIDITLSR